MRNSPLYIALVILVAACRGDNGARPQSATGGTMIVAIGGDVVDALPPFVGEQNGRMVQDLVFDRLAEIDSSLTTIGDKTFAPRLARRWTWAPDSLSIAFEIDPRARWHDGKPVTAGDVRYSFRVFTDTSVGSPVASLLTNVDSISVRDSSTAVVWFKRHTAEQFYDVAYQLVIMPEHVYGSVPLNQLHTSDAAHRLVGSGQFRVGDWKPGVHLELLADTANYRGRPKLDRVVLTPVDVPTGETQVLTGQSDFMEAFPADHVAKLADNANARLLVVRKLGYTFMGMNQFDPNRKNALHPIFSDRRVRRALSMAVDREGLVRNVFGDNGHLGRGPFPMALGLADSTLHVPPYDTAAAAALLDSAGWRRGTGGVRSKAGRPLHFSLLVFNTSVRNLRYAELLQEQFRRAGAQVDVDRVAPNVFFPRMMEGRFDAIINSFGTDPSPGGARQNWATSGFTPQGQNFLHYSNARVDALLDSATYAFDAGKRKAYASGAFQQIIDDLPAIWLFDFTYTAAVSRRIEPATMRLDEWWANLADWSIPPDKRIERDRIGLAPATSKP